MKRFSSKAIDDLVSKFSDKSLPKGEWTHQTHVIVGLWHNVNYDFDTALDLVKSKIKAYNIAVGTLNTDDSGYHETLTIFWMILTKKFLLNHPSLAIEDACNNLLNSEMASKNYPLEYYSSPILFSKEARKSWINGDIQKISLLSDDYKLNNHFDLTDEQFEQDFSNCALPPGSFSHEAHLRLAWIHLKKHGLETAIATVCDQLTNYVNHLGAQDKYHKTVTVAAVIIVHHFMQRANTDNFFDFVLKFPKLKKDFKGLIESHYSFNIFQSEEAKGSYLEPDLLPFSE